MIVRWGPPWNLLLGVLPTGPFASPGAAPRALLAMLTPLERHALARRRKPAARAEHLAGRLLARAMLAHAAGCEVTAIVLGEGTYGRPRVSAPARARGWCFSIAHADGLALCVVADRDVGADLESVRNLGPDPLAVADAACTEREREELRRTPPAGRAERLLTLWTVKEALAKAAGLGARLPFAEIAVAACHDGTSRVRWPGGGPWERSRWRLGVLHPSARHVGAIALRVPAHDEARAAA